MNALRRVTFAVGLALLAATAHVTITATGGYTQPGAILILCIALGGGVGALAIGSAWADGRRRVASWIVAAIVCGELFGMILTAERLVVGREAQQAPLRDAEATHAKAAQRVAEATAALAAVPATSARLEAALAAKATADAAAVEKSAERGCVTNCRALLEGQVDAAQVEVAAARAEVGKGRTAGEAELTAARTALAGVKAPASATPLADRVGVAAWVLDLITAALGSMAANGLGVGLIAFAAHGRREDAVPELAATPIVEVETPRKTKTVVRDAEHAAQFAVEALTPARDDGADLLEIHGAYRNWCQEKGVEALPAAKIGAALAHLFDGTGITVAERDGRRVAMGVAVKAQTRRKALGHMVTVGAAP